jgi:hypothetical protein
MHIGAPPAYTPTELAQPATPVTPELAVALVADSTTHDVLISIVPPTEPLSESQSSPCKRAPVDICCVIDVSGSMNSELKASLEEGEREPLIGRLSYLLLAGKAAELTGLSTLDVVKHAVKTIVATMQSDDRISIVTFSNAAKVSYLQSILLWLIISLKVIVGLTPMTATGKAEVLQAVRDLRVMVSLAKSYFLLSHSYTPITGQHKPMGWTQDRNECLEQPSICSDFPCPFSSFFRSSFDPFPAHRRHAQHQPSSRPHQNADIISRLSSAQVQHPHIRFRLHAGLSASPPDRPSRSRRIRLHSRRFRPWRGVYPRRGEPLQHVRSSRRAQRGVFGCR